MTPHFLILIFKRFFDFYIEIVIFTVIFDARQFDIKNKYWEYVCLIFLLHVFMVEFVFLYNFLSHPIKSCQVLGASLTVSNNGPRPRPVLRSKQSLTWIDEKMQSDPKSRELQSSTWIHNSQQQEKANEKYQIYRNIDEKLIAYIYPKNF